VSRQCLFAALSLSLATAQASCVLPAYSATYDLFVRGKHIGRRYQQLSYDHHRYRLLQKTDVGLFFRRAYRRSQSEGEVTYDGFQVDRYWRKNNKKQLIEIADFNWLDRSVKTWYDDVRGSYALRQGAHNYDPLIYLQAYRCALLQGEKPAAYQVFARGRSNQYLISPLGYKTIKTALGQVNALEVKVRVLPHLAHAILWLDPKRHYLLLRSIYTDLTGRTELLLLKRVTPA
jgi:hypothetical protein